MTNLKFRAWLKDENKMVEVKSLHLSTRRIMYGYSNNQHSYGNTTRSFDELLEEYYRQFLKVKHLIEKENHKTFDTNWFNEDVIKGFGKVYDKFSKNKGWIKIE